MQHLGITPLLDFQVTSAQTCTIWAVNVHFARQNCSRHKRKANMHQNDLFPPRPRNRSAAYTVIFTNAEFSDSLASQGTNMAVLGRAFLQAIISSQNRTFLSSSDS